MVRLRLTPYIAALLVLSAAGTAIASHGANGFETLVAGESQEETEVYDQTLYAQQGWWRSSGASVEELQNPDNEGTWFLVEPAGTGEGEPGNLEITVTAQGPVLAAMDVFEAYPNGQTPDCPQPLVTDKLPGEDFEGDPIAYPFDVAEQAQYHQRSATDQSEMTVTLDVSSEDQFYVAIYPQAVSAAATSATEDPSITWELEHVSESNREDEIVIDYNKDQPELPYDVGEWTGSLLIDFGCLETGTGTTVGPEALPELPGQSPLDQRVTSMLDAQLPVD